MGLHSQTEMNKTIKFTPLFCPEVELAIGDVFSFQCSGIDEDGNEEMYNDFASVVEENGEVMICHNGTNYDPYTFLYCDYWDGNMSMDYIRKICNYKS